MGPRFDISDHQSISEMLLQLGLNLPREHFTPRYNVAPLTALWVVYSHFDRVHLTPAEWALIPRWAKIGQFPRPLTVARSETIWERASYKNLVRRYRCLIPVNGFYLWSKSRHSDRPTPWHVRDQATPALGLGAVYQYNIDGNMQVALVTVPESKVLPGIGERLPMVVPSDQFDCWLTSERRSEIDAVIGRAPETLLATQVSDAVTDPSYQHPNSIVPVER